MTPATQAKVLRLLQEQTFERVGGNETIHTNVRVIAATNQNLEQMVADGQVSPRFVLPAECVHDPSAAAARTAWRTCRCWWSTSSSNRPPSSGGKPRWCAPETIHVLEQHNWPGNVRELQSAIKFALVHSRSDIFTPESLPVIDPADE